MEARHSRAGPPHVDEIVNDSISKLATYSGLILTICLVIIFFIRFYVFEGFLLRRVYGSNYTSMNDEAIRRGFVNHHVAGLIKIVLLVTAAYPFMSVAFGSATMRMFPFSCLLLAVFLLQIFYMNPGAPPPWSHVEWGF